MKKLLLASLLLMACAEFASAQTNAQTIFVTVAPSGACQTRANIRYFVPGGSLYTCQNGTWAAISGGGGGSGTVISVTGPSIFTWATPTTTPTATLNSQSQNIFLASPNGSSGIPIFRAIVAADVPTLNQNTTGTSANLSGTPTLPNGVSATTQSQNDNSTKLATTAYTDLAVANAVSGINPAVAVLAASTANVVGTYSNGASGVGATYTVTATGAFTLDGVAINTIGQRVLLKNQSSAFQNGIYTATVIGASLVSPVFTRALDYDQPSDINTTGAIPVQSGTVNTTTSWLLTSTVNTVGTDALTYVQFSIAPSSLPAYLPPYDVRNGVYYIPADGGSTATLPSLGSWTAIAGTGTITTAANNDVFLVYSTGSQGYFLKSPSGTTSVEIIKKGIDTTSASGPNMGSWLCDSTNSKIYTWGTYTSAIALNIYTFTGSCTTSATVSFSSTSFTTVSGYPGLAPTHLKLSVSGTTLTAALSLNGGITFTNMATLTVGTIASEGVFAGGNSTMDIYSLVAN
jgi:hypothetical protein